MLYNCIQSASDGAWFTLGGRNEDSPTAPSRRGSGGVLLAGVGGRQVREELWVLSGRPVPFFQLKQKPGTGTSPFLDVASLPEVFQASDTA